MINKLIKLANALDESGFKKEADEVDEIIKIGFVAPVAAATAVVAGVAVNLGISIYVAWQLYNLWQERNPDSEPRGFLSADHEGLQKELDDEYPLVRRDPRTDGELPEAGDVREYDAIMRENPPPWAKKVQDRGVSVFKVHRSYQFYERGTIEMSVPGAPLPFSVGATKVGQFVGGDLTNSHICSVIGYLLPEGASYIVHDYSGGDQYRSTYIDSAGYHRGKRKGAGTTHYGKCHA